MHEGDTKSSCMSTMASGPVGLRVAGHLAVQDVEKQLLLSVDMPGAVVHAFECTQESGGSGLGVR